jgi:hypothetical protein
LISNNSVKFLGLAGLSYLEKKFDDASKFYEEALSIMDQMKAHAEARLEKIHSLHNLREVLSMDVKGEQSSGNFLRLTKGIVEVEDEYYAAKMGSVLIFFCM